MRKISNNYLFVVYCGAFWGIKWLGGRKYILVRWNKPKKSENQAIQNDVTSQSNSRGHHNVRAIFFKEILLSLFFNQCSHFNPFLVAKISRRQNTFIPMDVNSIVFLYLQPLNILLFTALWKGIFDLLHCNIKLLGMTWKACDSDHAYCLISTTYPCFYLFNQTEQS